MGRRAGSRLEEVLVSRCLEPLRHRLAAGPAKDLNARRAACGTSRSGKVRSPGQKAYSQWISLSAMRCTICHEMLGDRRWLSRREVTFVRPATSPVWVRPDGPGVRHRAPEVLRVGKPCPVPGLMEAVGCPGCRSPPCRCLAMGTLRLVVLREIAAILPVEDHEPRRALAALMGGPTPMAVEARRDRVQTPGP